MLCCMTLHWICIVYYYITLYVISLQLRKNPIPEEACAAGLEFLQTKMEPSELHLELIDLGVSIFMFMIRNICVCENIFCHYL